MEIIKMEIINFQLIVSFSSGFILGAMVVSFLRDRAKYKDDK